MQPIASRLWQFYLSGTDSIQPITLHIIWTENHITSLCYKRYPTDYNTLEAYTSGDDRVDTEFYRWCPDCEDKLTPLQLLAAMDL